MRAAVDSPNLVEVKARLESMTGLDAQKIVDSWRQIWIFEERNDFIALLFEGLGNLSERLFADAPFQHRDHRKGSDERE